MSELTDKEVAVLTVLDARERPVVIRNVLIGYVLPWLLAAALVAALLTWRWASPATRTLAEAHPCAGGVARIEPPAPVQGPAALDCLDVGPEVRPAQPVLPPLGVPYCAVNNCCVLVYEDADGVRTTERRALPCLYVEGCP